MGTVYVVGVNHAFQVVRAGEEDKARKLRKFLTKKARKLKVSAIAEEFLEEAKEDNAFTVAEEVAHKLGVYPCLCEPNEEERVKLGIKGDNQVLTDYYGKFWPAEYKYDDEVQRLRMEDFAKREEYWFGKIEAFLAKDIIFICGNKHAERFVKLIKDKGHKGKIIGRFGLLHDIHCRLSI